MVIDNLYSFGDMVYLKTDKDQLARLVYSFEVFKNGEMLYKLVCGTITSSHYEFEISREANVLMTSTN